MAHVERHIISGNYPFLSCLSDSSSSSLHSFIYHMGFLLLKQNKKRTEAETGDRKCRKLSISESRRPRSRSCGPRLQNVVQTRQFLATNTPFLTPSLILNDSPYSSKPVSGQQFPRQRRRSEPRIRSKDEPRYVLVTPPQAPESSSSNISRQGTSICGKCVKSRFENFRNFRNMRVEDVGEGIRFSTWTHLHKDHSQKRGHKSEGPIASDAASLAEGINSSSFTTYNSYGGWRRIEWSYTNRIQIGQGDLQ